MVVITRGTQAYYDLIDVAIAIINEVIKEEEREYSGVSWGIDNQYGITEKILERVLHDLGYGDSEVESEPDEQLKTFEDRPKGFPIVELQVTESSVGLQGSWQDTNKYEPLEKKAEYQKRIIHGRKLLNAMGYTLY